MVERERKEWEREREREGETRYLGVARENALSYTIPQPCNVAFTFQSFSINSGWLPCSTRERVIFAKQSNRRNMFHFRPSLSLFLSLSFSFFFLPALKGPSLPLSVSEEGGRGKSLCSDQRNTEGVECERSRNIEYWGKTSPSPWKLGDSLNLEMRARPSWPC